MNYIHTRQTMRALDISSISTPLNCPQHLTHRHGPTLSLPSQCQLPKRRRMFSSNNVNRSSSSSSGITTLKDQKVQCPTTPTSVPVRVAHELFQAGHRYLDVRTPEEFSAGHSVGAVNVPYMLRVGSGMTKNPNFLKEVLAHFGKDDEIIIGCQSGKRSLVATTELLSAGFTGAIDMAGGYAAWAQIGLPTES